MPPKHQLTKQQQQQLQMLQAKRLNSKYWRPHGSTAEVTSLSSVLPSDRGATETPFLSCSDHFLSAADNGTISLWDIRKFRATGGGEDMSSRKADATFDFSPFAITDVKMLNSFSLGAIAEEHLGVFDIRGASGTTTAAAPLKTYKHPVEISSFGESVCTTHYKTKEHSALLNVGDKYIWILDEDGVVYTLSGVTESSSAGGTPPPLRLSRRPFGARKNLGSGLAYCSSFNPLLGCMSFTNDSLQTTQFCVTLGMDSELQLYSPNDFYGPFTEDTDLLPPSSGEGDSSEGWAGSAKSEFTLRCTLDVGLGATPPSDGGRSMQMGNPALSTCMSMCWPYVACGRADGTYVIVDCDPPALEANAVDEEEEEQDEEDELPPFRLEVALASPAHAVNGLAAMQWYPTNIGPSSEILVTVALSGELSAWKVGSLLDDDDESNDPACVFAGDVRTQCVDKNAVSNAMVVLPQSATGNGSEDGALPPSKILVGSSDGSIAVFDCAF